MRTETRKKIALPRIQRQLHNKEQNSIGVLTVLLKLLFYSPEIKWAFLCLLPCLSISRSLIPFPSACTVTHQRGILGVLNNVCPTIQAETQCNLRERDSSPCACWTIRPLLCALFCLKPAQAFHSPWLKPLAHPSASSGDPVGTSVCELPVSCAQRNADSLRHGAIRN